jgi:hypothetical protein
MTKSSPTLTQSGLLAVLLQRQRYKISQSIVSSSSHWNTQQLEAKETYGTCFKAS